MCEVGRAPGSPGIKVKRCVIGSKKASGDAHPYLRPFLTPPKNAAQKKRRPKCAPENAGRSEKTARKRAVFVSFLMDPQLSVGRRREQHGIGISSGSDLVRDLRPERDRCIKFGSSPDRRSRRLADGRVVSGGSAGFQDRMIERPVLRCSRSLPAPGVS